MRRGEPSPTRRGWLTIGAAFGLLCVLGIVFSLAHALPASPSPRPSPGSAQGASSPLFRSPVALTASRNAPLQDTAAPAGTLQVWIPTVLKPGKVYGLQVVTPNVSRLGKFEAHFNVLTQATNPSLPYDAHPPAGLAPDAGISVDVLFSQDGFQTTQVQPAFFFQPYRYADRSGKDHFIPNGGPRWAVRFTPQQAGLWEYRIRLLDAEGEILYPGQGQPALRVLVSDEPPPAGQTAYSRRGFLRVSRNDPRYFEFGDGSPFIGVGFNVQFDRVAGAEAQMQSFEDHKMNFMRVWLSMAGINGSQWTSWGSHHLPMNGYLPAASLDVHDTYAGADVAWRLDDQNPCLFADFWQGGIPVEPDTAYTVWARLKLDGVSGPLEAGEWGFVIKQAGWLDKDCAQPGNGQLLTRPVQGTTGWITVSGQVTTGSQQEWLDFLYLARQNATRGQVFIDEVRLWRSDDPAQVNILREPVANSHLVFDPLNSARWDLILESAERHGVYLKLVVDEKNEWIRNRILPDGAMTTEPSTNNFYGKQNTKSRWLQQAWWRYLIARWGYSTAIHSFEFVNEGDPNNRLHFTAANVMARAFHQNDPSRHMATTSFWGGFPNQEFWSNPAYSEADYADLHAYISTGWGLTANFLDEARLETGARHVRSAPASARLAGTDNNHDEITPAGLLLRGAGEWIVRYWMMAENFTANCPGGPRGGQQRVRWLLDGGASAGGREGVVPANRQGNDRLCTSPGGTFDWRPFRSDLDRDGLPLPAEQRLILPDDQPHEFSLRLENRDGTGGAAWIDDVELVSPSGEIVDVLGRFDTTPMDDDTAWYNYAYGLLHGGGGWLGARKPLVRGETGIDFPGRQAWNRDLLKDTGGVWLHNNLWGQINPAGMLDLFWWAQETIPPALYRHFLAYRNFMEGIPLNNGQYRDLAAQASSPFLRAWGQRDDASGRMHLWAQNTQHTWKRVVFGPAIQPVTGTLTISGVATGRYRVEWWDAYALENPIFRTEILDSDGSLILALPAPLADDVAVKIAAVKIAGEVEP